MFILHEVSELWLWLVRWSSPEYINGQPSYGNVATKLETYIPKLEHPEYTICAGPKKWNELTSMLYPKPMQLFQLKNKDWM